MPDRTRVRQLAAEFTEKGDPLGWFEQLYQEAELGRSEIPWDDRKPNAHLLAYWSENPAAAGKTALVIGCGLGDDAEQLAVWGLRTTAFDISPTAIKTARSRFPKTSVNYVAADLFQAPVEWHGAFDFVFESNTLQALPANVRPRAIQAIAQFVKPGGRLLVIARGREEPEPEGELPARLTRRELAEFERCGLRGESFRDASDSEPPHSRRFRITYIRP